MQLVDFLGISYIGADLLTEVVQPLQAAHTDSTHRFVVLDLTQDRLPQADMILCRDCLVHLSFLDIRLAVHNVVQSGIEYLMTTTFPGCEVNEDIVTGDWRPINLERPPFDFPPPSELINEGCSEGNGLFADKSLGIWHTADLADLPFLTTERR
jgi:hypothetical protein